MFFSFQLATTPSRKPILMVALEVWGTKIKQLVGVYERAFSELCRVFRRFHPSS